jgi:hypothetical protein
MTTALTTVKQATVHGISGAALITKRGKQVGVRISYSTQSQPASVIREQLKAQGLKGSALKDEVNKVLTGGKDMAWAMFDANTSVKRSAGFIPDYDDVRKNTSTVRFVRPERVEPQTISRDAALAALGLTEEQLKALAPAK